MSQIIPMLSVEKPPPSRNQRSPFKWIVLGLVVCALAAVGVTGYQRVQDLAPVPEFVGQGSGSVVVIIAEGDSLSTVAQTLAAAGVVQSAESFVNVAELDPRSNGIQPGAYTLRLGMSSSAALDLVLDPDSRAGRMVVPEGMRPDALVALAAQSAHLTSAEIRSVLDAPEGVDLPGWAESSAQGLLFPASYDLIPGMSATDVVSMMVDRFNQAAAELQLGNRAKRADRSPRDVLIVASLVQAEARPQDMARVAAVAWNRLDKGMKLQFDSTVNYANGTSTLVITKEMLAVDSPYNTFLHAGLPPAPINSPGMEALEAALSPAEGDWLYFVTVDPATGRTRFTSDYQEFLRFKREFKKNYGLTP